MSRGQIGDAVVSVPVIVFTILLLLLFVVISSGLCGSGKFLGVCPQADKFARNIPTVQQVDSRVLSELALSDSFAVGSDHLTGRQLLDRASQTPEESRALFGAFESGFDQRHGCGNSTLVIASIQEHATPAGGRELGDGTYNTIDVYVDYPVTKLEGYSGGYPLGTRHASSLQSSGYLSDGSYVRIVSGFTVLVKGGVRC